jgi:hypothetical protein
MWPKRCGTCHREYRPSDWETLEYVGPLDDGRSLYEQRNCAECHSTLAIRLGKSVDERDTEPSPAPLMSPDDTGHDPSHYSPTHGKSDFDED